MLPHLKILFSQAGTSLLVAQAVAPDIFDWKRDLSLVAVLVIGLKWAATQLDKKEKRIIDQEAAFLGAIEKKDQAIGAAHAQFVGALQQHGERMSMIAGEMQTDMRQSATVKAELAESNRRLTDAVAGLQSVITQHFTA